MRISIVRGTLIKSKSILQPQLLGEEEESGGHPFDEAQDRPQTPGRKSPALLNQRFLRCVLKIQGEL
jgi:hypothetical protein